MDDPCGTALFRRYSHRRPVPEASFRSSYVPKGFLRPNPLVRYVHATGVHSVRGAGPERRPKNKVLADENASMDLKAVENDECVAQLQRHVNDRVSEGKPIQINLIKT